jgi:hypothetical protein
MEMFVLLYNKSASVIDGEERDEESGTAYFARYESVIKTTPSSK